MHSIGPEYYLKVVDVMKNATEIKFSSTIPITLSHLCLTSVTAKKPHTYGLF